MFVVKEHFVCLHTENRGTRDPYKAVVEKIIQRNGIRLYKIHFYGWKNRFDTFVTVGEEAGTMIKGTVEDYCRVNNRALPAFYVKLLQQQAKRAKKETTPVVVAPIPVEDPIPEVIKAAFEIRLPRKLMIIWGVDQALILKHQYTNRIPAKVSVDQIMKEYIETLQGREKNTMHIEYDENDAMAPSKALECSAYAILKYFNFLYKPPTADTRPGWFVYDIEQRQFAEWEAENLGLQNNLPVSSVLGIAHLVRMIVRFPNLFPVTHLSEKAHKCVMFGIYDLIVFLNKNIEKYKNGDTDGYDKMDSKYLCDNEKFMKDNRKGVEERIKKEEANAEAEAEAQARAKNTNRQGTSRS